MVFVHGYTGCAFDFQAQLDFMKLQQYTEAELYGTSYGEFRGFKEWMNQTGMACEYVRGVSAGGARARAAPRCAS